LYLIEEQSELFAVELCMVGSSKKQKLLVSIWCLSYKGTCKKKKSFVNITVVLVLTIGPFDYV